MLTHLVSDVRYGLRALLARPGFLAAAMLTLALGIGANAAVFSVIHTLLLKPLPFADSERLVDVYNSYPGNGLPIANVSIPDYLDRRDQALALADSALYTQRSFNLAEEARHPNGSRASSRRRRCSRRSASTSHSAARSPTPMRPQATSTSSC